MVFVILVLLVFIFAWFAGYQYCVAQVHKVRQALENSIIELVDEDDVKDSQDYKVIKIITVATLEFTINEIDLFNNKKAERSDYFAN